MPDAQYIETYGLTVSSYAAGEFVFRAGENGNCAYLVTKGAVAIVSTNEKGERVTNVVVPPGEIFGEMSVLRSEPRSADAIAAKDSECIMIEQEILAKRLANADPFIRFWIEFMSDRLRDLAKRTHA